MEISKYVEDGCTKVSFAGIQKMVLLIGDSIREGYCPYVKEYLQGEFDVVYPNDNCRNTQYVLTSLRSWYSMFANPNEVEVVSFNCGHWDIAHWNGEAQSLTTEADYARNLKRIVNQLQIFFPRAKILFFTTTPVLETYKGMVNPRTNQEIERYNQIAMEVLSDKIIVRDMYNYVKSFGENCYKDYAHLKDEYCKKLGEYVANTISSI